MVSKETRYCRHCKVRHPIDDFTHGQYVCKYGRAMEQNETARKNIDNPRADDYEKHCKKCDETKNAKEHFQKDMSRPDGFFLYCRECESVKNKTLGKNRFKNLMGLAKQFRAAILKTVLKTIKDTDRSIARQLVEDFRHEGEAISFTGREWQIQILNDLRPTVVVRKPSQKGLTWLLERFMMALLIRYSSTPYRYKDHTGKPRSRFIEGIYSFETMDKASKWSKIRLKKIKDDNPHIRDALVAGGTDSALLMKLDRASLHLVGRATIGGVLSISGDIVIIDEKDRDQDPSISTQIGSRTLESEFMKTETTKGVTRETSTPEASGAGISLQYESSDQAEWEIYCVKCGAWQTLTYPECIGNFYEIGEEANVDSFERELTPFWQCMNCKEPINWNTIGNWNPEDPDYYENCRWVVRKPKNYNAETGKGIGGYQVPFASPQRSAAFFMAERDDPEHDLAYLNNHLIGLPYDDIAKTLLPDNFHVHPESTWGYSGATAKYVLGCDTHPAQGGYIVICKQVAGSVSPAKPEGKWTVVYLEHVKNNRELWDDTETIKSIDTIKKGRLYELITEYNVSIAVVDVEPDTNEVEKLIDEFAFSKKVWSNKSGATAQETFTWSETEIEAGKEKAVCKMYENKVAAIDYLFNKIRFGDLLFLEKNKYLGRQLWSQYQLAHTNLYKSEIKAKSAAFGEKLAAQNIREVYKKRVNSVHDHWVMATKFCVQGIRILNKIKGCNKHIAPPRIHGMDRMAGM